MPERNGSSGNISLGKRAGFSGSPPNPARSGDTGEAVAALEAGAHMMEASSMGSHGGIGIRRGK